MFDTWSRRGLIALGALALFVQVSTVRLAAQSANPLVVIRYGASSDDVARPILYAVDSGAFKRAGLDVQLVKLNNGAAVAAAVAGGSLDMGKGSAITPLLAYARGVPFTIVGSLANYLSDAPYIAVLVAKDSTISAPKDLIGKTIGVVGLQDQLSLSIYNWLNAGGVDPARVKFVEVGNSAGAASVESGRIDATAAIEPSLSNYLASGKVKVLAYPFNSFGKRVPTGVTFATTSWVAAHRDVVATFNKVAHDAAVYVASHESETTALAAAYSGFDLATLQTMHPPERATSINPADFQPTIDAMAKYGFIAKSFPAKDVVCDCAIQSH
jgi:NitT/TauT family transport system substrate-binding protein